jgi:HK97 family phage prohead protease
METKDFKFKLDDTDDAEGKFTGLASVYDVVDAYNEKVKRGAFRKTLTENKGTFPLFWLHDIREPLGIIHAKDSTNGLKVEGHLNLDVQSAVEKRSLAKQGAVKGLSIGFKTIKDEWDDNIRILKEIKLHEISLIPLNIQATPGAEIVSMKSMDEFKPFPNEHSARIRDPKHFDPESFRRKNDGTINGDVKVPKTIAVIWAKLKESDEGVVPQALRFPVKNWTVTEAKAWLKSNNVKYVAFEPAEKSLEGILSKLITIESVHKLSDDAKIMAKQSKIIIDRWLKMPEPSADTQGYFTAVIEGLRNIEQKDKPNNHLYEPIIKNLQNLRKEKIC